MVAIAIVDKNGVFRAANTEFCKIVKYSEVELIGKTFSSITHPSDQDNYSKIVSQITSGSRDSDGMTKRYISKLGEVVYANLKVVSVKKGDQFICLISQAVKLDPSSAKVKTINLKKMATWITAAASIIGYVIAEVIKNLAQDPSF